MPFSGHSLTHWLQAHLFIFISQCLSTGRFYSGQMALLTFTGIHSVFLVAIISRCHSPLYFPFYSLNNFFLPLILFPEHAAQSGCLSSQGPLPWYCFTDSAMITYYLVFVKFIMCSLFKKILTPLWCESFFLFFKSQQCLIPYLTHSRQLTNSRKRYSDQME